MNAIAFGFLGLAAVVGLVLMITVISRWPVAIGLVAAGTVLVAWEMPVIPPVASVLGSNVYLQDVVTVAALAVALKRWGTLSRYYGWAMLVWSFFGLSLAISLVKGLAVYSTGPAVNEFRSFIYPYAAFSWAMSVDWNDPKHGRLLRNGAVLLGWALCIVALYHFSSYGFGSTSTFVDLSTGDEQTTRPLVSSQALVLLLCTLFVVHEWSRSKRALWGVSSAFFLLVIVASQQRTVWACAIAAAILYLLAMKNRGRALALALASSAVVFLVSVTVATVDPGLLSQLSGAASDTGTYDARINGWTVLTDALFDSGPMSVTFGEPMGFGFGRYEGVRWVEYAPHNWYVTVFLRVGAVGLLLLAIFCLRLLALNWYRRLSPLSFVTLGTVLVYGWTYSWPWFLCLFWGFAASQAFSSVEKTKDDLPPVRSTAVFE